MDYKNDIAPILRNRMISAFTRKNGSIFNELYKNDVN